MTNTEIVAAIADVHSNSTVALCADTMRLDDGQEIMPSKGQKWLRKNFLNFCDEVETIKKKYKAPVNTIFNGDLHEGDYKERSTQIFTRNKAVIQERTYATLEPIIDISDRCFTIRGTAAHTGQQGELEEAFAADITISQWDTNNNTASWWELKAEFGGVYFISRHHGKLGYRKYTRPNALNVEAVNVMVDFRNKRCPDIVLQAHNHLYGDTGNNYPVRVISMPCWSLRTEYSRRNNYDRPDIGGMIFVCQDGQIIFEKYFKYVIEEEPIWTAKKDLPKAKGYKSLLSKLRSTK